MSAAFPACAATLPRCESMRAYFWALGYDDGAIWGRPCAGLAPDHPYLTAYLAGLEEGRQEGAANTPEGEA